MRKWRKRRVPIGWIDSARHRIRDDNCNVVNSRQTRVECRRRGCSSMVEQKLPKLTTRVRFPSPAPIDRRLIWTQENTLVILPPQTGEPGTMLNGPRSIRLSRGHRQELRRQQKQGNGGRCAPCAGCEASYGESWTENSWCRWTDLEHAGREMVSGHWSWHQEIQAAAVASHLHPESKWR